MAGRLTAELLTAHARCVYRRLAKTATTTKQVLRNADVEIQVGRAIADVAQNERADVLNAAMQMLAVSVHVDFFRRPEETKANFVEYMKAYHKAVRLLDEEKNQ